MTSSIENAFGSRLFTKSGFLLNNQLTDFSFRNEIDGKLISNRLEPGKRPRSSMSPTIVTKDGSHFLITGSQGGSRIITTVLQVIVNVIDHEMQLGDAVTLPRIHHQWLPEGTSEYRQRR